MKSKRTKIAAVLTGVALLGILVLPYAVDIDSLRPQLEASLQSHLGREVHIGHLQISVLAGGARAENFSIADDPAFSSRPFLRAKSLEIGVNVLSLIFSRTPHLRSLTIEEPELVLAKSSSGKWNFSGLGSSAASRNAKYSDLGFEDSTMAQNPSVSSFLPDRLKIINATLMLPSSPSSNHANVFKNIDVDFQKASFDSTISFSVSTHSDSGRIELRGEGGPINHENPDQTPFHATLKGSKADLRQIARLSSSSGLSGILKLDATVTSDGRSLHSEGTAGAERLRLSGSGAGSRQPVSLHYATDYSFARRAGTLTSCEIFIRNSSARLGGTYQVRGDSLVAHLRLNGSQLLLDDVEGALPALGIDLPGGSKLRGGTVSANLALDGPFDRLITTGTAQISNAHLSGFDLGSKLSSIPGLGGVSSGSDLGIVALSTGFRISPQGTHVSSFNGQFSGIGALTGDGDIDATEKLNFNMGAHLASGELLRSVFDHTGLGKVPNDIPFKVVGTTSMPIFLPDLSKIAWHPHMPPDWRPQPTPTSTPKPKPDETAPVASSDKRHGFWNKVIPWHKQTKLKDGKSELARK